CFRWTRRALVLPQLRMELIELAHLSVGTPPQIAPPRISQVEMCNLLEAAVRVKAGSQLIGKRLVVNKSVCACRSDGALVQVHGLEWACRETGNLGADQRRTILEVLRTIRCPAQKLSLVPFDRFSMHGVWISANGLAACSAGQRGIEVIFLHLQHKE